MATALAATPEAQRQPHGAPAHQASAPLAVKAKPTGSEAAGPASAEREIMKPKPAHLEGISTEQVHVLKVHVLQQPKQAMPALGAAGAPVPPMTAGATKTPTNYRQTAENAARAMERGRRQSAQWQQRRSHRRSARRAHCRTQRAVSAASRSSAAPSHSCSLRSSWSCKASWRQQQQRSVRRCSSAGPSCGWAMLMAHGRAGG